MSILINGMEMPKNCADCLFEDTYDGYNCRIALKTEFWGLGERPSWCPLVEVPPHGRLIEADNLLNTAFKLVDEETFRAFRQIVLDVPTIIQTSEEVYNVYNNTVGNLHWTGTHSGEHIIQLEESE